MVKKKEQELDVIIKEKIWPIEKKKFVTSDGMEFETLNAAEEHEEKLKNPYYVRYRDKCKELQEITRKLNEKQDEIELLKKKVEELERLLLKGPENRFPTQQPQDPWSRPCPAFPTVNPADPSQQPYRWNCGCTPKYN